MIIGKRKGITPKKFWKKEFFVFSSLTLIFFILFFNLNRLTLFTSDDFAYSFVYKGYLPTSDLQRIDGLVSIIESQINHWYLWNGRFVAHSIVQFWLQFKNVYFDVFNSIAYIFVLFIVLLISKLKEVGRILPVSYLILFIAAWFYLPEIGKSVLWISGSGNYLWTSMIYLIYFYYIINVVGKNIRLFSALILIILGFLAGACNENTSPAVLLCLSIYLFINTFSRRRSGNYYSLVSILVGILGFILMMSSPGTMKRGAVNLTIDLLLNNFLYINKLLLEYWILYLSIALLLILLVLFRIKLSRDSVVLLISLSVGHFAAAFSLVASPEIPKRTLFGSVLFLLSILLSLLNVLLEKINKKVLNSIIVILVSIFTCSYFNVTKDLTNSYKEVSKQYQILYDSPKNSDVEIPLLSTPQTDYNAYLLTNNLKTDPNDWFNQWMAKYFDKNSVTGF